MTRRGWLDEAPLLGENYSMRHVDSTRTTQRGWLDEGTTRRGRLGEDHTTRQDDSTRLLWVIREGHLFCELFWRVYLFIFFQSFEMFSLLLITFMANHCSSYYRHISFHFISFSIIILSAFLPANFVTWMIMVLMVFSILFQDHEFNATNCTHKHSFSFSPCVQIYFSAF